MGTGPLIAFRDGRGSPFALSYVHSSHHAFRLLFFGLKRKIYLLERRRREEEERLMGSGDRNNSQSYRSLSTNTKRLHVPSAISCRTWGESFCLSPLISTPPSYIYLYICMFGLL